MNIGLPQPEIVRSDTRRVVNLNLPEPVVIVSTLFAFGGVVTSAWKLTAVSALILIIIGFARGWAKVSLSRVELSREVAQHRLYVGETTSLELIMENRKTLPLPWLRVDFSLPDGLAISSGAEFGSTRSNYEFTQSFFETFSVGSRERVRAERLLLAARRGSYRLGAAHLQSGDLFGFYETQATTATHAQEIIVFPSPRALPGFRLPDQTPDGVGLGRSLLHEDSSRPAGTRPYQPSDPVKRMDWKTTARRQQPMVRLFDPSRGHRVMVALDARTLDDNWRYKMQLLEAAVAAAVSVSVFCVDRGHQVGFVTNGAPPTAGPPLLLPATGTAQLDAIMLALVRVQANQSTTLADVFDEHARPRLGGTTVRELTLVHVTAHLDGQAGDWLLRLRAGGASVMVVYVGEQSDTEARVGDIAVFDYREIFADAGQVVRPDPTVLHA
tara:strand:- start:118 stop:1440 length:1323 start_codon:yes stop_codon:yes gene_type:complete